MKKILLAVFCLALLLTMAPGASAVELKVYQLALNDRFMDNELTVTNMPVNVNGSIYIPYTAFDRNVTGVDLGVFYGQEKSDTAYRLTLYSRSGTYLTFDLLEQTCFLTQDGQREAQSIRAVIRYDKVYVPASAVCRIFDLQYVYTPTRTAGDLIRIKSNSAVLSDAAFLDAAASALQSRYDNYIQSLTPTPTTAPVPTAKPTPTGGSSGGDNVIVTTPPVIDEGGSETETPSEVREVLLTFRCEGGGGLDGILGVLAARNLTALFLFPAEELEANSEQIRAALGQGHSVGLMTGADGAAEALAEGNAVLERIAWYRTHIALVEGADQEERGALYEDGWSLWLETVNGVPAGSSLGVSTILNRIDRSSGVVRLTLDDSAATADGLSNLLQRLAGESCTFPPVLETRLAGRIYG